MGNNKFFSHNTRALAARALFEVLSQGHSLNQSLPVYKGHCKKPEDAAFLQALVFGALRWYPQLAFVANQLLQKPLKTKDMELFYLICVGLFQLRKMNVADHAAIAETVEAARLLNKAWGTGLVNAVLRSYQRQSRDLEALIEQSTENNPALFYAHPEWLVDELKVAWPEYWKIILNANNAAPPLTLRVNLQKTTCEEYLKCLRDANIEAKILPATKTGIVLKTPTDITKLPGFDMGLFSVQDEAAQFAAELLDLKSGHRVLDACAAPGGKTCHILESNPNLEQIIALDVDAKRCKQIDENLQRLQLRKLGLSPVKVIIGDAAKSKNWWDGKPFDRILLDAPCSASGVIRRHPDIKYLKYPKDIQLLRQQQLQLLRAIWPLLKPGGILLYATCSVFPQENTEVLQDFLKEYEASSENIPFSLPDGISPLIGQQLLPGIANRDGFYYAKIRNKP